MPPGPPPAPHVRRGIDLGRVRNAAPPAQPRIVAPSGRPMAPHVEAACRRLPGHAGAPPAIAQPMFMVKFFQDLGGGKGDGGGKGEKKGEVSKEVEVIDPVLQKIKLIERTNPQVVILWGKGKSISNIDLLACLKLYLTGGLVLYRGVQQCHPMFPKGSDHALMTPKVPGSTKPPDFTANDNDWLPMSPTRQLSLSIALSWSSSIVGYFKNAGGMNARRPVALVLEKRIGPTDPIAFCFDDEIQIKGTCRADQVTRIWIDQDWGLFSQAHKGLNFEKLARDAKVPINE
ncbi:MAG TPA: hypothetical protein VF017_00190 [Thermoanaerobaculia bacterium]|nr:hypothetical protein [Thermoanaerobaculia bacterium]